MKEPLGWKPFNDAVIMTSFIIDSHVSRPVAKSWQEDCPFCRIIEGLDPAFKVYEDEYVIAFLDILPLRKGHTLVVPKKHVKHLSDLPNDVASALGSANTRVAKALTLAFNNKGLNVVCNQEYAQAVPHVHYHIVPAPSESSNTTRAPTPFSQHQMGRLEFESRGELDEDEGKEIAEKIRAKL